MRDKVRPSCRTLTRAIIIAWRFFAHFHGGEISLFVISSTSLVINVWHSRPTCALRTSEISSFANKNARHLRSLARNGGRVSLSLPPLPLHPCFARNFLMWSRWIEAERPVPIGSLFGIQFRETNRKICGCAGNRVRARIRKVPFTKDAPCQSHNGKRIPRWYHRGMYDVSATPLDFHFSFRSAFDFGTRKNRRYSQRNSPHLGTGTSRAFERFNNRPKIAEQQKGML